MSVRINDKQALIDWDKFRESIRKSTPVDLNETAEQKKKRIAKLEADPQEWKKYYFSKFMGSESPDFHIKASKRLINNFLKLKHWYEVRHWVRGLAKTTTTMMDVLFLVMTGKLKNIIYTSSTYDAAEAFLTKYQCQLDSNDRLINDYGKQELPGSWSMGLFKTRKGVQFLALGAGQSPRGNGNDEIRPDCILVDDFDTDEECLNVDIINKKWSWFEKALFFTVDTAKPYLIIWLGNIIAEDCCVVRAGKMADHCEIINIRDSEGKSVWPQKNSEADIDYQLSKVSYESGQSEMHNNPMSQGQTFKEETWGKCPPLKDLPFVISYSDPATSNKDKPAARSKAHNSCKAVALIGFKNEKFYLYKCFLDVMTNNAFIDCMYAVRKYVDDNTALINLIENNTLQDPFFQQVLMPLVYQKGPEHGGVLSITPDGERKGDKWFRIEATLEPLYRLGNFVFNIEEKENPHMKRMVAQFKTAKITSKTLDGPDACQGAVKQTQDRTAVVVSGGIESVKRSPNNKRF